MWKHDKKMACLTNGAFVVIFVKTMCNKTIIRFGFCDIQNNTDLDLDYSGYHKSLFQ